MGRLGTPNNLGINCFLRVRGNSHRDLEGNGKMFIPFFVCDWLQNLGGINAPPFFFANVLNAIDRRARPLFPQASRD